MCGFFIDKLFNHVRLALAFQRSYLEAKNTTVCLLGITASFQFTALAMRALRRVSNAPGFNIGMNQGSAAGAGIAAHLHQHVVPRWNGDANFMPIVARTRTMPALLETTRELVAQAWQREVDEVNAT